MTSADIIVSIVVAAIIGWAVYIHFFKNKGDLCATCSYKKTCDINKEELRRDIHDALDKRERCSRQ